MATSVSEKLLLLMSVLAHHPSEFLDRLMTVVERGLDGVLARHARYEACSYGDALALIAGALGNTLEQFLNEAGINNVERYVLETARKLAGDCPFSHDHNADLALARVCYVLSRVLRPATVVETGVAYGTTSAFILAALEANAHGVLCSVDLPPLGRRADEFVGVFVPDALKHRWYLHRGVSRRVLPSLLPQLGEVGIFVHDSLHTYSNIRRELFTTWPYLTRPSLVIVDDITGNAAFAEWVRATRPTCWGAVQETEKPSLFGVSLYL